MKNRFTLFFLVYISIVHLAVNAQTKPHFIGFNAGISIPVGAYQSQNIETGSFTTPGFSFGGDGAWFITKTVGVGIHLAWNQHPVDVGALGEARVESNPFLADTYIRSDPYVIKTAMAGVFYQKTIYKQFSITANVLGGLSEARTPYQVHEPEYFMVNIPYEIITESIDRAPSWMIGFGLRYNITPCYALVWENNFFSNPFAFTFKTSNGYKTDNKQIAFLNTTFGVRFNLSKN
jgi:hypothetical protein